MLLTRDVWTVYRSDGEESCEVRWWWGQLRL